MKKLSIQLNQDYRSFKNGFNVSLNGNLIVLSGVNGSGKSQLIDIIAQRESHGTRKAIPATIKLDGNQITRNDVLRRSFKENVNVPELTYAGTETITSHKNNAWNAYYNYLLNYQDERLWDFKESSEQAKKILIEKYGEQKFNNKQITQTEFKDTLPSDFVWKSDDIFTNFIGELFFNYALDVYDTKAESVDKKTKFDPSVLPVPPWKQLNDLFKELGFEYRFKDDYFVKKLQINEQPLLFQIKNDGTIDENESRKLADLSDGEKAIISLSFASLSGVKHDERKVLLLDEFDANFNPSLTEIFYKILDQHFISKGILVVIATHSPTTISLASDTASFYEVFKPNSTSSERIFPVQKHDYAELKVANKTFYTRIADQAGRIAELEKQKEEFEKKITELKAQAKPVIFIEGEIDEAYLNKTLEIFGKIETFSAEIKWIGYRDANGNAVFTGKDNMEKAEKFLLAQMPTQKTVLFYDIDCRKRIITQENLTIYCPQEIADAKYKTGIEHLLIVPRNFDISNISFRESKKSGDKEILIPNKTAIKEYVFGLSIDQQKQWLTKINDILNELENTYLK